MNRNDLMQRILDDRQSFSDVSRQQAARQASETDSDRTLGHIADMLDGLAELLTKNTQMVRVANQPKDQKVSGVLSVQEAADIIDRLEAVDATIADGLAELKDSVVSALEQEHEVSVTNHPEPLPFPEITIPERVRSDIVSMPKYVSEGFDRLYRAIREKDLSVTVNPATPDVNVDLDPLQASLKAVEAALKDLLAKEAVEIEKPDFSPMENVLASIYETMVAVRDNTGVQTSQTFRASWDKSLHMQSLDAAASTAYKTVADRKVTDYLQFTDHVGTVWRKTYSYDTDGDITSWTAWTQQ